MVTDVYSRILDEDRMKNARLLEESFYGQKHPDSQAQDARTAKTIALPEGVDAEALAKVLANPEMTALLISMAKSIQA